MASCMPFLAKNNSRVPKGQAAQQQQQQQPQQQGQSPSSTKTARRSFSFAPCGRPKAGQLLEDSDDDASTAPSTIRVNSEEDLSPSRTAPVEISIPAPFAQAMDAASEVSEKDVPYQVTQDLVIEDLPEEAVRTNLQEEQWGEGCLYLRELILAGATDVRATPASYSSDCSNSNNNSYSSSSSSSSISRSSSSCSLPDSEQVQNRDITLRLPVPPAPLCPPSSAVTIRSRLTSERIRKRLLLETSTVTHDVPFGSNFVVQVRSEMVWEEDELTCHLTQSVRIVFLQKVGMLKSIIQSGALNGQARSGQVFLSLLRALRRSPCEERSSTGLEEVRTCFVWEVERRATRFHGWRTPLLAVGNDPRKARLRWVDSTMKRHPWFSEPLAAGLSASGPPILPNLGFELLGRWEIQYQGRAGSTVDVQGWQYAPEFGREDPLWVKSSSGCFCRRRLWALEYRMAAKE